MTGFELSLCLFAVVTSSASQIFIKSGTNSGDKWRKIQRLLAGVGLQLLSVLLVIVVLRTIQLSQLVPFAGLAYLFVPLTSHFIFNEKIIPGFWLGAALIIVSIVAMNT